MMKQFLKDSAVFLTMATMGYVMLVIVWAHFVPFGFLEEYDLPDRWQGFYPFEDAGGGYYPKY